MRATETRGIKGKRNSTSIGYVIIPGNVDRDVYVADCLRRGVVSIQFENGSYKMDVPVSISILQSINFPNETKQLGSCLVCSNEYVHNQPIVVGRLLKGDENTNISESEFRFEKYTDNGSVSISGKADKGDLLINVSSRIDNGGKVYLNISHPENKGKLIVDIRGDFEMELQSMILNVLKNLNVISKEDINIDSKTKINIGTTDNLQPTLKGDDTVEQLKKEVKALSDIIQSIANIVPVAVPPSSVDATWATWQAAVALITERGNFDSVQSEKIFIE